MERVPFAGLEVQLHHLGFVILFVILINTPILSSNSHVKITLTNATTMRVKKTTTTITNKGENSLLIRALTTPGPLGPSRGGDLMTHNRPKLEKYLFLGSSGCIFGGVEGVPVNPHVMRVQNMYGKGG